MIPLTGKTETLTLDDTAIAALELRHKAKDVRSEMMAAHLWLLRHPKRRPVMLWRFIDAWLAKAPAVKRPPVVVTAWWATEERTINQGAAIGLTPRPGESLAMFRDRVGAKMRGAA